MCPSTCDLPLCSRALRLSVSQVRPCRPQQCRFFPALSTAWKPGFQRQIRSLLVHPQCSVSWRSWCSTMCCSTPLQESRGPSGPRSPTSGMRARWPRVFDTSCSIGYTRNTVSTSADSVLSALLRGRGSHQTLRSLGPLVRLGPNTVSVDTVEGLNKIFSATAPIDKSPFYQAFTPGFKSSFASTGSVFKEKKSILAQAFSQKKLDAMESSFMHHTKNLCEVLKTEKRAELDESLSAFTIDILSDVCFGETFDLLHNPEEKKKITRGLEDASVYVALVRNATGAFCELSSRRMLIRFSGGDSLAMAHSPKGCSRVLSQILDSGLSGRGKSGSWIPRRRV